MKKKIGISLLFIALLSVFIIYYNNKAVSAVYPIYRSIEQDKIEESVRDYNIAQSKHFIIKYTDDDKKYVNLVIETAEKHYYDIVKDLGYEPDKKSVIIIYHDPEKMNQDFSLAKGESAMGIYLNGVISIESPDLWISSGQDVNKVFQHDGPVVHEFTHLIVDDVARGNYPVWFTEGVALLEEYRQDGYIWGEGLKYDTKPYSVKELTDNFNGLDEMLAYKRSFEIVKAISDKYGMESIRGILKDLGKGLSMEDSFYINTGKNLDMFAENVK